MTRKINWRIYEYAWNVHVELQNLQALSVLCSRLKIIFHLKAHRIGIYHIHLSLCLFISNFLRAFFFLLLWFFHSLHAHTLLPYPHNTINNHLYLAAHDWPLNLSLSTSPHTHSSIALKSYSLSEKMKSAMCVSVYVIMCFVMCSSFINKGW